MKKIETHLSNYKLDIIKDNLLDAVAIGINGVIEIAISRVVTFGNKTQETRTYRGRQYTVDFSGKIKVEIFVEDYLAIAMVQELAAAARAGETDDLIITLSSIEETSNDF